MTATALRLALLFTLITSAVAFAQSSDEFGRASAGLIELSAKSPSRFSGSLGLTTTRGYGAALGGTIVNDRLWFFGTAERTPTRVPQINTNWNAIGSRNALAASSMRSVTIPSSFLSLHYTGIVSSNSFVTAKVSTHAISPNRPLW